MLTRTLKPRHGPRLFVRPLERGDVDTVKAVFARLGEASRRARFNGPKACLSDSELEQLTRIDASHHALVAHVDGDPQPAAIARLVRTGRDTAELAFVVADCYQHRGIGSALAGELLTAAQRFSTSGPKGPSSRSALRPRSRAPRRRQACGAVLRRSVSSFASV